VIDAQTDTPVNQRTLADYLRILRRGKWLIVGMTVLVAGATLAASLGQAKVYRGSAQVLLNRRDLAASAAGAAADPSLGEDPGRFATTQAALARSAAVAAATLQRAGGPSSGVGQFLANSSVTADPNADLLDFTVDDGNAKRASVLANAYASAYAAYKLQMDTNALQSARRELDTRIAALQHERNVNSALYRNLVASEQQLHTMQLLQSQGTVLTRRSAGVQVKPTPKRDAFLGAGFGLLLGLAGAFVLEALDKRIKSEEEIERELGLPLIARIPEPPRRLREQSHLTMLAEPMSIQAEAIWRLATNLEFMNPDGVRNVIMVTSAVAREGKSTTLANVAVALARSGRRVALVDLDLRQPTLSSLFDIHKRAGLTDVVLRRATLEKALIPIRLSSARQTGQAARDGGTNGELAWGRLVVLPTGPLPPTPSEFVGSDALVEYVLTPLREQFDYVLIDAPPMGIVGDAAKLSANVDALLVVARLGFVDRPSLVDFKRQLSASPAPPVGLVIAGVDDPNAREYGAYFEHPFGGTSKSAGPASQPRAAGKVTPSQSRESKAR
jgi:polysaccharide biosynthesis transport protein